MTVLNALSLLLSTIGIAVLTVVVWNYLSGPRR
jgi:hypothetical protein